MDNTLKTNLSWKVKQKLIANTIYQNDSEAHTQN